MPIKYHDEVVQGSDEWYALRCGLLTASEIKLILTPTLKIASNDKERAHLYELMAQRITKYVEPSYISDDMLRGQVDEVEARILYSEHFGAITESGFITNDKWGFTLGYSPDGLVGDKGLVEFKSRRQKFQVETLLAQVMPVDYLIQVQSGLLISEREWCDFGSYCGGLPLTPIRIFGDDVVQTAIIEAAAAFEENLKAKLAAYEEVIKNCKRIIPTERKIEQEITL